MDKLTMAHEYFMKHGRNNSWMSNDIAEAWKYADAMQAEADSRVNKERPDVLREWRPAWGQSPEVARAHGVGYGSITEARCNALDGINILPQPPIISATGKTA